MFNVPEVIQMIGVDVEHHDHGGGQRQEVILVFTGLDHEKFLSSGLGGPADQREHAADMSGGVAPGQFQDGGQHRGRRGFSVSAAYTDSRPVLFHELAQQLGPLHHWNALGAGFGQLRVVLADSGVFDDQRGAPLLSGPMPDIDVGAQCPQPLQQRIAGLIGTADRVSPAQKDLGQPAHADAAHADKMNLPPHEIADMHESVLLWPRRDPGAGTARPHMIMTPPTENRPPGRS
jgi:hypothetical protein